MMVLILSAMAFTQTAAHAQAWCGQGYRYDSFGLGVADQVTELREGGRGGKAPSGMVDPVCFELGRQWAASKLGSERGGFCFGDYDRARREGLRLSGVLGTSPCAELGYMAGAAWLRYGAREGRADIAGQRCVDQYARGRDEGSRDRAAVPPADNPERECYLEGHYDGQMFRLSPRR